MGLGGFKAIAPVSKQKKYRSNFLTSKFANSHHPANQSSKIGHMDHKLEDQINYNGNDSKWIAKINHHGRFIGGI